MSSRDPGDLMLQQSLLNTGRQLLAIGQRCAPGDFLTRRLLAIATKELGRACCSNIDIEDLDRAYVAASPEYVGDLTRDQHVCRYTAEVLRLARGLTHAPREDKADDQVQASTAIAECTPFPAVRRK